MIVEYDYKPYVKYLTQTGTFSYTPPGNGNNKGFIYVAGIDGTTILPILPTITFLQLDKTELTIDMMKLDLTNVPAESGSFNDMFLQFRRMTNSNSTISTNISFLTETLTSAFGTYFLPITYRKLNFNITTIGVASNPIIITLY